MQVKQASQPANTSVSHDDSQVDGPEASSIPPENPVKPAILDLPTATLYSGLVMTHFKSPILTLLAIGTGH